MEPTLLIAMLLIFIGAFIQTTTGFGLAVVVCPLLILFAPEYIPGPIIVVGLFLASINVSKYRENVSLSGLKLTVIGLLPGTAVGALLLFSIDVTELSLFLGVIVLLAVAASLLPYKIELTPNRLMLAGFLSGFLGTSSGIGGPPMALLLQHQKMHLIRANLAAFFVVSSILALLIQIPIGYMSLQHLYLALPLIPASYLGYRIAILFMHRISTKMIRAISLVLCSVAGFGAIYSSLMSI